MKKELCLYEEVTLLALRDEEGTMAAGMEYDFAVGGACVAELLLEKRIRVDDSGKKPLVEIGDEQPLGDPLLDECLERIRTAKRRASIGDWVSRFAHVKRLKHRVAEQLCQRGILQANEGKVLLIFSRKTYPTLDPPMPTCRSDKRKGTLQLPRHQRLCTGSSVALRVVRACVSC